MQENLYRGKPRIDGGFITGYLCYAPDTDALCIQREDTHELVPVIPETVGRSTGETDLNGHEVFENDLIGYVMGSEIGVIRFGWYKNPWMDDACAGHLGFYVEWCGGPQADELRKDLGYWLELQSVIGNTTDNPELLEDDDV